MCYIKKKEKKYVQLILQNKTQLSQKQFILFMISSGKSLSCSNKITYL